MKVAAAVWAQPETRIEHRNENGWDQTGCAQPDAAAHHKGHDEVGFPVEKVPDGLRFLAVAPDPFAVFDAHFIEHQAENAEYCGGKQDLHGLDRLHLAVGQNAQPRDVEARRRSHAAAMASSVRIFM